MMIKLLLFAAAKDRAGASELMIELEEGATIESLKSELAQKWPDLQPLISRSAFAINQTYGTDQAKLSETDEVGWIPPVSGG